MIFNLEKLEAALNKMSNEKACDTLNLNADLLKLMTQGTRLALLHVIHHAFDYGFPQE